MKATLINFSRVFLSLTDKPQTLDILSALLIPASNLSRGSRFGVGKNSRTQKTLMRDASFESCAVNDIVHAAHCLSCSFLCLNDTWCSRYQVRADFSIEEREKNWGRNEQGMRKGALKRVCLHRANTGESSGKSEFYSTNK